MTQMEPNTAANCQPTKKRVRISTSKPSAKVLPPREIPNVTIWWQVEDYERFWDAAQLLVRTIRSDDELLDCVTRAYKVAGLVSAKVSDEAKLSQVLTMVRIDHRITALWCGGISFRGLERQFGRKSLLHPGALEKSDNDVSSTVSKKGNTKDCDLQGICELKSRQDRVFARLMGAADAAVVAFQDGSKSSAFNNLMPGKTLRPLSGIKQRQFHSKQA